MNVSRWKLAVGFAVTALLGGEEPSGSPKVRVWVENGCREKHVDVLFVGDGYTVRHMGRAGKYWRDVDRCAKRLFDEVPFSWYRLRFNVRALMLVSSEAGCDASSDVNEVSTALNSCFDTSEGRLLFFRDEAKLARLVKEAGGADIVFVMVNTERYGGSGTTLLDLSRSEERLPAPTFSAQDTRSFLIALHELGHSFAGLADEYVDESLHVAYPLPKDEDVDLCAPNVSLHGRFDASSHDSLSRTLKWGHFLELPGASAYTWVHEGGYYRAQRVFRPFAYCRMSVNEDPFCPICCEEIAKAILRICGEEWDDAGYHKTFPLDRQIWPRRLR